MARPPVTFEMCPSLPLVREKLKNTEALDFDQGKKRIPPEWNKLRDEARAAFKSLNIWEARLVPLKL